MRFTRLALWLVARIVPSPARSRWIEEWRSELDHGMTRKRDIRSRLSMTAGTVLDAIATRRVAADRRRAVGPRAGIFHAFPQDVRYALRGLVKAPGFTFGAIASLSIGIAASAAAFTFVNAHAFRPFPGVHDQDSLVRVQVLRPRGNYSLIGSSFDKYLTLRSGLTMLSGISAHYATNLAVGRVSAPADVPGAVVTGNYFSTLGVRPAAGRFFAPEEDAAPWSHPAAVISHRLWERMFGGDPAALSQWITVNGAPVRIVGVAPRRFAGVRTGNYEADVWITFALSEITIRDGAGRPAHVSRAGELWLDYVGRLGPGVTIDQARAQASALQAELSDGASERSTARVSPIRRGMGGRAAPGEIAGLLAVPLIVLAIACVNAANLLLARATRRAIEWRIRLALGGTRWRIIRQILTESLLISLAAGVVGLLLTYWSLRIQEGMLPVPLSIDWRVLAYTLATAAATAIAFGIGPAIGTTRSAAQRAPSAAPGGTRVGQRRVQMVLVAMQAALSIGLLITGTQFMRAVSERASDDGLADPDHLVVASFDVGKLRYPDVQAREFYARLRADARALHGVTATAVAAGDFWTPTPDAWRLQTWLPGDQPAKPKGMLGVYTSGDPFSVLDVPMVQGRAFVADDHEGRPRSVIVNQPFADQMLNGNALGRSVRIGSVGTKYEAAHDVTIVGVVAVPDGRRNDKRLPLVYYPVPLEHQPSLKLLMRFDGPAAPIANGIREVVRRIDDRLPVATLRTGRQMRDDWGGERRWLAASMAVLGVAALVLAAAGLFSVVSYVVAQRRREIGIRMTLGASASSVVRMILRQALGATLIGCLLGAAAAAAAGQIVRSKMFGVSPIDPLAFAGAALVMLTVMAISSAIPAMRATRVDPMDVLRTE